MRGVGGFDRFRSEIVLVAAVMASVALMGVGPGPLRDRIGRYAAVAFYPPRVFFRGVSDLRTLRARHAATLRELTHARLELARSRELVRENTRLRRLLDFCLASRPGLVGAQVIGRGGDWRTGDLLLTIDKGARHGIEVDAPVVAPDGLVGRVAIVGALDAVIEPLYSRRLAVSAYDQRTRVTGIVRWGEGGTLRLDNVPLHCEVGVGDTLLTSGLGGLYPRGIPIGEVRSTTRRDYALFRDVEIEPRVDVHTLEEVLVVVALPEAEEPPPFRESDQSIHPAPRRDALFPWAAGAGPSEGER